MVIFASSSLAFGGQSIFQWPLCLQVGQGVVRDFLKGGPKSGTLSNCVYTGFAFAFGISIDISIGTFAFRRANDTPLSFILGDVRKGVGMHIYIEALSVGQDLRYFCTPSSPSKYCGAFMIDKIRAAVSSSVDLYPFSAPCRTRDG